MTPYPVMRGEIYKQNSVFLQVVAVTDTEVVYRCRDFPRNVLGHERKSPRDLFERQIANGVLRRIGRIVLEAPRGK